MRHYLIRIMLTLGAVATTVLPLYADLNDSHLMNPDFAPHARLHIAWLLATGTAINVYALILAWKKDRVIEAGWTSLCLTSGLFVAWATASLYGGSIRLPSGSAAFLGLDGNVINFSLSTLFIVAAIILERQAKQASR